MPGYQTADATAPAWRGLDVVPSDVAFIENTRSLYVGGAGNVKVTLLSGVDITFSGVGAGTFMPIQVTRVFATGTTATLIVALY